MLVMDLTSSETAESGVKPPLWLLAELTYRCPLQCPYCSNPLDYAQNKEELSMEQWIEVFKQARELGSVQLGFSGGEPLVRKDLGVLIKNAHELGFYTNLITSGLGLTETRIAEFTEAGLDHIQISFQAGDPELNEVLSGSRKAFEQKLAMAKAVKAAGYPMVLNFVLHRRNMHQLDNMIELSMALDADYVELASCQYYGWAKLNRQALMPSEVQIQYARERVAHYREQIADDERHMKLILVTPDYYEERPKKCIGGWGQVFLTVNPNGVVMPCQNAAQLPIDFPTVADKPLKDIWEKDFSFNVFRGFDWMEEPCRSCSEKEIDHGGCRCQAYMMTKNMYATDPVCAKSPHHDQIIRARQEAGEAHADKEELVQRKPKNSAMFFKPMSEIRS